MIAARETRPPILCATTYVQPQDDTAHLRSHPVRFPVKAGRFIRIIREGTVDVLKGKNFIASLLDQQFVLSGLRQYGIIGNLDGFAGPAVGDHDNGIFQFGRTEDFAEKQAGILRDFDVLAELEESAAAKRRDDHDHQKDTGCLWYDFHFSGSNAGLLRSLQYCGSSA